MRRITRFGFCVAFAAVFAGGGRAPFAAEIDRLLVAVNGKVLTQLDLEFFRRMNSLMLAGGPARPNSAKEEIERLVDLELMRQEMQSFPEAAEDETEVQARMQELTKLYDAFSGGLAAAAARSGLAEADIRGYLRLQASILRFVNFRFRPFATPSEAEIDGYYRENLVPRLESARAPVPPLQEVSGRIHQILQEEKINAALEQWISDLRSHARIEKFLDAGTSGKEPEQLEGRPASRPEG